MLRHAAAGWRPKECLLFPVLAHRTLDLSAGRLKIRIVVEDSPYAMPKHISIPNYIQHPTRLVLTTIAIALSLSGLARGVYAQAPKNPPMPSQQSDSQKDDLYAEFSDHRRVLVPEQQKLAYEAGKEYLRRYGGDSSDPDVKVVRKFVTEFENVKGQYELDTVYGAKNYAKTFELGRSLLQKQPENFYFLSILAEAGYDNSIAGNASFNAETVDYAKRAIQLLNDGKVKKADPFKSIDFARGFLNFAIGNLLKDESPVEAAAAFLKAVQSDSPYRTEPLAYHRLGAAILKGEFAQLSAEYNEKYGGKKSSTEQQAMFERINHLVERAIDAYARAVALGTSPQQQEARNKILAQLTALYKNFHNGSDTGLNELIATVLSKPLPSP